MSVIVRTFNNNIPALCYTLTDVLSVSYSTSVYGGFMDAQISLNREPGIAYEDVAFNMHVEIADDEGDKVWEGFISAIPQKLGESKSFEVQCTGYYAMLSYQTSSWLPKYYALTDLAQIIRDGITSYAPGIVVDTSTAPNTGKTITYIASQVGAPRDHFDEVLKNGDTNNSMLGWQVWEDRKFYLKPIKYDTTSYDFETSTAMGAEVDIGLNADNFYTRVTVRYRNGLDTATVQANNTTLQTLYGRAFGTNNPSATRVPYIREPAVVDITSHGIIATSQAQGVANTLLNRYSGNGIRILSSHITISSDDAILFSGSGMPTAMTKIRAGKSVMLRDLSGATTGLVGQSLMYINSTKYTQEEGKTTLELNSDGSVEIDTLLSGLLNGIRPLPE